MRRPSKPVLLATVVVALLPGAVLAADFHPTSPRDFFKLGGQEIGIAAGYGFAIPIGDTGDYEDLRDEQYVYVAPRWGIGISGPMGEDAWYRGNFELLGEGTFLVQTEPKEGFAGGFTALLRYNFLPDGAFIPFIEVGAGILSLDFDLENQSDGLNFTVQAGLGFHYFIAGRTALTGEWRYNHISNADIMGPNVGIHSSLFLIGVTIFLW